MSYGRKYRVPFKDINDVSRTIYIYEDGYTGSETVLTAAANPIVWDENSDEDLSSRVRGITGRLELIEENYGDLADFNPATPMQYKVVCQDVFFGFIKPQNSTNNWEAGPRVLKFNILSPLAMAYDIPMPINTTMGMREMGQVMVDIIDTFGYSYISMPKGNVYDLGEFFRGQVRGMHICPYANDKDYHYANDDEIFAPISIGQLLEEICDAHDLIAHDAIDMQSASLVFSRISDTNGMYRWSASNIRSGDYDTATQLTSVPITPHELMTDFSVASNDNDESLVKPYSYIDFTHEGEKGDSVEWPTAQSEYKPRVSQYYLTPRGIWLTDVNSNLKLGLHGAYKTDHFDYCDTLLFNVYPSTISASSKLFSITFYNVDKNAQYRLKFKYSHSKDDLHDALQISARGKGGWYTGNGTSGPNGNPNQQSEQKILVSLGGDSGHIADPQTEYETNFALYMIADEYITINFYVSSIGNDISNLYVRSVELEKLPVNEDTDLSVRWGEQRFVRRVTGGVGNRVLSIAQGLNNTFFSNYYTTDYEFVNNDMQYMLRSQRRMQIYARSGTLNKLWYMYHYNIYEEGGWRIIAISYNVKKCIYKLTLQKVYND